MKFENKGNWIKQITESKQVNEADIDEELSKETLKAINELEKFAKAKHLKILHIDNEHIDTGLYRSTESVNLINFFFTVPKADDKIYIGIAITSNIPTIKALNAKLSYTSELAKTQSNISKAVETIKFNYEKLETMLKDVLNAWKDFVNSSGSFEKSLAKTFELADKRNLEKLCSVYPELGKTFVMWKSSGRTDDYKKL